MTGVFPVVNNNQDTFPDCHFLPAYNDIISAWKCGSNKVYVAHIKPNGECNTLCLNYSAAQAHLDHGDYLGPCHNSACPGQLRKDPKGSNIVVYWDEESNSTSPHAHEVADLEFNIHPNPSLRFFILEFKEYLNETATVIVYNSYGNEMERLPLPQNSTQLIFGESYPPGMYIIKLKMEEATVTRKIIKQNP